MANFKQALHPISNPSRLNSPIFIMEIYISTAIAFVSSAKTISKTLKLIGLIKSFLPLYFSAKRWFNDGNSINIIPRPSTWWRKRSLKTLFKRTWKTIRLLLIVFIANSGAFPNMNKSQCWIGPLISNTCNWFYWNTTQSEPQLNLQC